MEVSSAQVASRRTGSVALHPEEKVRLLSMMDILEPLSREEVEDLSRRVPDVHVERGKVFYTPREKGEVLFMLKKGRVKLYTMSPDGRELVMALVERGSVFGEMSLTAQQLHGAYAEAVEPAIICAMSRAQIEDLVYRKPQVGLKMMGMLSERLALYQHRIEDIGLKEVPARLASLILQFAASEGVVTREGVKIPTRYTHEQLGAMLGAKRETVTRALTVLQESGVVELRRRRILINDPEELERISRTTSSRARSHAHSPT